MTLSWQDLNRKVSGLVFLTLVLINGGCDNTSLNASISGNADSSIVSVVTSTATSGALLSIPRYKIYQDEDEPNRLWTGFEVEKGPDTFVSEDGGKTWQPVDAMGWEYHMSMAGSADGYIHFINRGKPAATYYRLHGRAFEPTHQTLFSDYGGQTTTGNIAVNNDEVVVFTRNQESDRSPIHFHRSTDNGATWQNGSVAGTGNPDYRHRIGSCLIDGEITLAYWQGGGSESGRSDLIILYRWTGAEFSRLDHDYTTTARNPLTREYAITQDSKGLIHLVTWDVVDGKKVVRHTTRTLDSAWSPPQTVVIWENDNIFPQLAAFRDGVILVYLYNPDSSESEDAQAYYKLWRPDSGWSITGLRVSAPNSRGVRSPMVPQRVAAESSFVPVLWAEGESVRFKALENSN